MSKRKTQRNPARNPYQAAQPHHHAQKSRNLAQQDVKASRPSGQWKDTARLVLFWSYVLMPMAWGVSATVRKALLLFQT
jgi:hypothetical protein